MPVISSRSRPWHYRVLASAEVFSPSLGELGFKVLS